MVCNLRMFVLYRNNSKFNERVEVMRRNVRRATSRVLTAVLLLVMVTALSPIAVSATPADASITVTDGGSTVYINNGTSVIKRQTDLYVTAKDGVEYYILSAGYVDVFYSGQNAFPLGSHFKAPFVDGTWVTTIAGNISTAPKVQIKAADNWKISVPSLAFGAKYELRIAAVKEGADEVVYGHQFVGGATECEYTSEIKANGTIEAKVINNTDNGAGGLVLLGIYNAKRLVHIETYAFKAEKGSFDSVTFSATTAEYPVGNYEYKAFFWGDDYAPLAPAIELNLLFKNSLS